MPAEQLYYTIYYNEDGDPASINQFTKFQLLAALENEDWGKVEIATKIPKNLDSFVGLVIIKGEIVSPYPVKVITALELL